MIGSGSRFGRHYRARQLVLDALAEVGPTGMTPNALEVSIDVPGSRLRIVLARLIEAGLVCRRRRRPNAQVPDYRQVELLLLTEYAQQQG
jgi:hypothetical protein